MKPTSNPLGSILFYCASLVVLGWSLYTALHWADAMGFQRHLALAASVNLDGKGEAPELEGGLEWFNVPQPLRLEDLRGKIVLLDFWTHGCINCQNVMPDLKRLEHDYAEELVVIGVHSAKFTHERETQSIRNAILRNDITHPVVNDANFAIWGKYDVQGWPSWVLIDPAGQKVATAVGEGHYERFDYAIRQLIERHEERLERSPIPLTLERDKNAPTLFSFPGKILADEAGQRLFIADSRNNRIVITDWSGLILDIAGTRDPGSNNGTFEGARFRNPQGLLLDGDTLFVADAGNHTIRALDLNERVVTTIAGTGEPVRYKRGGDALDVGLNSPWDLVQLEPSGPIVIAMAGSHQLWQLDLEQQRVDLFAGTGGEDITDGPARDALFAQPSGLTHDGRRIFVADSEASAIRQLSPEEDTFLVSTLIGEGLFDFGHVDGAFAQASLQRPVGIAYHDGQLFIADTYNNRIRVADLETETLSTLAGDGLAGLGTQTDPRFHEPAGIAVTAESIFIADSNNHCIRRLDRTTGLVHTLNIRGDGWSDSSNESSDFDHYPIETISEKPLAAGTAVAIQFDFAEGMGFNMDAPATVQLRVTSDQQEWIGEIERAEIDGDTIHFDLRNLPSGSPQLFEAAVTYFYCPKDHPGLCYMGNVVFQTYIQGEAPAEEFRYTYAVEPGIL